MINKLINIWGEQIQIDEETITFKSNVYRTQYDLEEYLSNTIDSKTTPETEIFILEKILIELQLSIFVLKTANLVLQGTIGNKNKEQNIATIITYEEMIIEIQKKLKELKRKVKA